MFDKLKDRVSSQRGPGLLLVDDDPKVRAFAKALLSGEEVGTVYEAPDGETAIEISYENHPLLVILDYQMPRMNGEAVARILRLISPGVRIILLSAVIHEAPEWADAYLEKSQIDSLPELVHEEWTRLAIS